MRPFNKKLQAIQKLEILSETQELKPEQIEKINSKSEVLTKIAEWEDIA